MLAIIGESFIRSVFLEILISKGSLNEIPKRCKDLQIFDEHSKGSPSTFPNDSEGLQVVKEVDCQPSFVAGFPNDSAHLPHNILLLAEITTEYHKKTLGEISRFPRLARHKSRNRP